MSRLSRPLVAALALAVLVACGGDPESAATASQLGPSAEVTVDVEPTDDATSDVPTESAPTPTSEATTSQPEEPAPGPTSDEPAPAPRSLDVDIVDFDYEPADININVGDTVTWSHVGDVAHTVTFTGGSDSGSMNRGDTFELAFDQAGTFTYRCLFHSQMQGTVIVG